MTCGLTRLSENVSEENGHAASARSIAGAIVVGKTNVPQTMCALETDSALFGRTDNPWDVERTPGGSSGGRWLLWSRAAHRSDWVATSEAVYAVQPLGAGYLP